MTICKLPKIKKRKGYSKSLNIKKKTVILYLHTYDRDIQSKNNLPKHSVLFPNVQVVNIGVNRLVLSVLLVLLILSCLSC